MKRVPDYSKRIVDWYNEKTDQTPLLNIEESNNKALFHQSVPFWKSKVSQGLIEAYVSHLVGLEHRSIWKSKGLYG